MGKNTLEKACSNELRLLHIISINNWIREYELSLLAKMSVEMVMHTCRRLEKRGQISRCQIDHGSGFYVRLLQSGARRVDAKSGKDVQLPQSWRHDALAIQVLAYLRKCLKDEAHIYTEPMLRKRGMLGKMPDGVLVLDNANYILEQEFSRKKGPHLRTQCCAVLKSASSLKKGVVIAYPYPPEFTPDQFDHEKSQREAMKETIEKEFVSRLDRKAIANRIWFCRVLFRSQLDRENAKPYGFELYILSSILQY